MKPRRWHCHPLRRLARGASVRIDPIDDIDVVEIQSRMVHYINALELTCQYNNTDPIRNLCDEEILLNLFVKIVPVPNA